MIKLDRTDTPAAREHVTVYLAFELSKAKWKLGVLLPGSQKLSRYTIGGGDLVALAARLADMRRKAAAGGQSVRVLSCYEAGLDGHWLHRWLTQHGVINHEIDPSSIEVNRRARRAKTDRIDLEKLMRTFLAYLRGEPRVCSIVHVPTVEDEDRKRRTREREHLIKDRTAHINRIKGLLHGQGIRDVQPLARSFIEGLSKLRTGDGHLIPVRLREEIAREHERLRLVARQIAELEAKSRAELRAAQPGSPEARIMQLIDLKGIGPVGGQELVNEVFYRDFDNRRQVGSYFGLTGTPYDSGERSREQGISKAGNRRARELAIELAWLWTVHQPDSALTRWFRERVRDLKGRIRRIAIVALARRLMVSLWRYLTAGVIPTGAVLHPTL
ncbi:IS110 family transposase [Bradyrhizobium erythrophlei]|uniref:IS110 family transposase n=1 Tax=Bradyrhizobium erythrophlei TaxID=1437360 RepID=UPI0035E7BD58